jgi:hypothetical protein
MPLEERVIYTAREYSDIGDILPQNNGEAVLKIVKSNEEKSEWHESIVLDHSYYRLTNLIEVDTVSFTWENNRLIAKKNNEERFTFIRPEHEKDTVVFKQTDELLNYLAPTVYEDSKAIVEIISKRVLGYEIVEPASITLTFELNRGLISKESEYVRRDIREEDTVWVKAGSSRTIYYSETPFPSDSTTSSKRIGVPEDAIPLQIFSNRK